MDRQGKQSGPSRISSQPTNPSYEADPRQVQVPSPRRHQPQSHVNAQYCQTQTQPQPQPQPQMHPQSQPPGRPRHRQPLQVQRQQQQDHSHRINVYRQITELFIKRAFADDQATAWLISKDREPPTSVVPEMMKYSFTADMSVAVDTRQQGHLYRKADGSDGSSKNESYSEKQQKSKQESKGFSPPQPQSQESPFVFTSPEKMVMVKHGAVSNRVFFSMTDSRTPFSFLEPVSQAVPGVRRGVLETTDTDLTMSMYHHLENGNSCLMVMCFSYDPRVYTRRCAMLIGPYPSEIRCPNINDVIESACATEMRDCAFCLMRGISCECPDSLRLRMRPILPRDQRDPWTSMNFFISKYDGGIKKERFELANFQKNVHIGTDFFYRMSPTLGHNTREHIEGYQHYLNEVFPFFNERILTWSIPTKAGNRFQANEPFRLMNQSNFGNSRLLSDGKNVQGEAVPSLEEVEGYQDGARELADNLFGATALHNVLPEDNNEIFGCLVEQLDGSEDQTRPDSSLVAAQSVSINASADMDAGGSRISGIKRSRHDAGSVSVGTADGSKSRRALNSNMEDPDSRSAAQQKSAINSAANDSAVASTEEAAIALAFLEEVGDMQLSADGRLPCKLCTVSFVRKSDLRRHVRSIHLPEQRRFNCDKCDAKFKRREHLDAHVSQVHEKTLSYPCLYCDKVLMSESNRRRHTRHVHSGIAQSLEPEDPVGDIK